MSSNPGSATGASASLSALVSTLIPVALLSGAFTLGFLILRSRQRRQYSPRSFLSTLRPEERSPDLPKGFLNWIPAFLAIPDTYVLNHQSLDAFLLLRYLKISTVIMFVGCCITWPVLFPVNATGGAGLNQLNLLSMSNVKFGNNPRYYAHAFCGWLYFGFIFYTIARESIYYINLRQAYLLSPLYSNRISSRTVLFTSLPQDYLNEAKLRRMFGNKVKNLWIVTDCKDLQDKVEQRDKVAYKLEAAETKLIKLANTTRIKSLKKKGGDHHEEDLVVNAAEHDGESGSVAARWIKPGKRPTHRTKFLIGKKVDTINWCRSELERLIPEIDAMQAKHRAGEAKFVSSVFIEFYSQSEAQAAFQMVAHHQALHMAPRFIGVNPEEVIWKNLRIKWWERIIRNAATIAFVVLLVIFWAIPVGLVGTLSNIRNLIKIAPFLSFLTKVPSVIFGLIEGLLPSVLLAVLMALLPIILRLMAKLGGVPSLSRVELRTQNFYFTFQVIQVFLVTTLLSSASATGGIIAKQPSQALTILANQLPTASNFYISFFILQGLTVSSGALLQIVGLILFKILGKFLDSTPRKMYKRFASLSGLGWGTLFPIYTNLAVIAITYSTIAPLVLGFATVGLFLIYLATRYNMLFVYNANIDTKGLVYPRALQQTTTGVYLCILCMIGLFAINKAIGPLVLMIVFLIFIILFHISLNSAIEPLLYNLPKSLESEEEALLSLEDGVGQDGMAGEKDANLTTEPLRINNSSSTNAGIKGLPPAPHKKPNFITKWLFPNKYTDYETLRRLVPRAFADISYSPETERDAYYNPAVSSSTPLLWIPRDIMGISRQEVRHTAKVIPITDEGAGFTEKGGLLFDPEQRPPIYQEKVYY